MHGGIINTFFALIFAIIIVTLIWGISTYLSELGSQEGMHEGKALFFDAVGLLFLFMCIYGVVEWIRAATGL